MVSLLLSIVSFPCLNVYFAGEAWGVAATSERDAEAEVLVDVQHVPEMTAISFSSKDQCLSVGGAASLSAMQQALQLHSRESPSFQPMADHLEKVRPSNRQALCIVICFGVGLDCLNSWLLVGPGSEAILPPSRCQIHRECCASMCVFERV